MARPAESYRAFRRAHARKLRLIWRRLPRTRSLKTGQITVIVPSEATP